MPRGRSHGDGRRLLRGAAEEPGNGLRSEALHGEPQTQRDLPERHRKGGESGHRGDLFHQAEQRGDRRGHQQRSTDESDGRDDPRHPPPSSGAPSSPTPCARRWRPSNGSTRRDGRHGIGRTRTDPASLLRHHPHRRRDPGRDQPCCSTSGGESGSKNRPSGSPNRLSSCARVALSGALPDTWTARPEPSGRTEVVTMPSSATSA